MTTLGALTGHVALAQELGPAATYPWSGMVCANIVSNCVLAQLLTRHSTRGASYMLW